MGADIKLIKNRLIGDEPVSDIRIKYSRLNSINISGKIISRLIDELPILFIACAICDGTSTINDIKELRYKESDRIYAMEDGLKELGINVVSTENSLSITGGEFIGGIIDSYGDHRIAMSFLIAGLAVTFSLLSKFIYQPFLSAAAIQLVWFVALKQSVSVSVEIELLKLGNSRSLIPYS